MTQREKEPRITHRKKPSGERHVLPITAKKEPLSLTEKERRLGLRSRHTKKRE